MAIAAPSADSQTGPKGALHTSLWVAQILLACAFGMAGLGKATDPIAQLAPDLPWVEDVPVALVRFIGIAEFVGGLGLVLPSVTGIRPVLTPFAALGLAAIMILAAAFHLARGEEAVIAANAVLCAAALFVAWGRLRKAPIPPR
jgi:putative oxidoreductase